MCWILDIDWAEPEKKHKEASLFFGFAVFLM